MGTDQNQELQNCNFVESGHVPLNSEMQKLDVPRARVQAPRRVPSQWPPLRTFDLCFGALDVLRIDHERFAEELQQQLKQCAVSGPALSHATIRFDAESATV